MTAMLCAICSRPLLGATTTTEDDKWVHPMCKWREVDPECTGPVRPVRSFKAPPQGGRLELAGWKVRCEGCGYLGKLQTNYFSALHEVRAHQGHGR